MIFLVGLPGNNQNEIGREIAQEIGYTFVDLQEVVENACKKTVYDFYETYNLRKLYEIIVLSLSTYIKINSLEGNDLIISTVQGIPLFSMFTDYIKKNGKVWYVKDEHWKDNIRKNFKDFIIFKDIDKNEYESACKIIEEKFDEMCLEIKDLTVSR